jgi:hypothetical protein
VPVFVLRTFRVVWVVSRSLSEFFLILGGHFNAQGWTSHAFSIGQNISEWNCSIAKTSSGQRPSLVSPATLRSLAGVPSGVRFDCCVTAERSVE